MKKIIVIAVVAVALLWSCSGFASTKYDVILTDPGFKKVVTAVEKMHSRGGVLSNYLNAVMDEDTIDQVIKRKRLDKEKTKFLSENKGTYLMYLHFMIGKIFLPKIDPQPTDAQYIYITGVIETHKRGKSIAGAKNGAEDQIEKSLFHESKLYSLWELFKKPGNLDEICDEQITLLYKNAKNRSNKK